MGLSSLAKRFVQTEAKTGVVHTGILADRLPQNLSVRDRLKMLMRFLKVHWHIVHSYLPSEIAFLCIAITDR
jgi:hypothetical protein